jgi:hypothetical protein
MQNAEFPIREILKSVVVLRIPQHGAPAGRREWPRRGAKGAQPERGKATTNNELAKVRKRSQGGEAATKKN